MRAPRTWLPILICVFMVAACASRYNAALRDIALKPEQRLAARVASMEQSARLALQALESAAAALGNDQNTAPRSPHEARLVNDADAAVFEYTRQRLIVNDVSSGAGARLHESAEKLHASMLTAEQSLLAAMQLLRQRASGSVSAEPPEIHSALEANPDRLAGGLERAKADVAEVSRDATAIITSVGEAK